MGNRFYYGMPATQAFQAMNAMDDDMQSKVGAASGSAAAAAGSASAASGSAIQANSARDAAIAAWQASTAPNEQLAAISKQAHLGAAVAVVLYDTGMDSDGGAWRKRCAHTTWENEPLVTGKWLGGPFNGTAAAVASGGAANDYFVDANGSFYKINDAVLVNSSEVVRGNGREFPALALVVLESSRVIIYDATQPDTPMWMVFKVKDAWNDSLLIGTGTLGTVALLNGKMVVGEGGNSQGAVIIDFIADRSRAYTSAGSFGGDDVAGIAMRNVAGHTFKSGTGGHGLPVLPNNFVNKITMAVLPGAQVDPATGLPAPTIAVATRGGAAFIMPDGSMIQWMTGYGYATAVLMDQQGRILWIGGGGVAYRMAYRNSIPAATPDSSYDGMYDATTIPRRPGLNSGGDGDIGWLEHAARLKGSAYWALGSHTSGPLQLFKANPATPTKSIVAHITQAYSTGWQLGDIRSVLLADTVAGNVQGSERVTNGDFSNGLTGWSLDAAATVTVTSGQVDAKSGPATNYLMSQNIVTVPGVRYMVSVRRLSGSLGVYVGTLGVASANISGIDVFSTSDDVHLLFTATATSTVISIMVPGANASTSFKAVSVYPAEDDRSVKRNGLMVHGTVTKAAVAAGAQLVAYSGFSVGNYLEQPYNNALDFGTGDFSVLAWINLSAYSARVIAERAGAAVAVGDWTLAVDASGMLTFTYQNVTYVQSNLTVPLNTPTLVGYWRTGGKGYFCVNNVVVNVDAGVATSLTREVPLRVGGNVNGTNFFNGSVTLLRLSATAPSAEQIAQIYNDESKLFQAGAQCTIYGNAGQVVSSLAYDDLTDLLHVGTDVGYRSSFLGLVRVVGDWPAGAGAGGNIRVAAAAGAFAQGGNTRTAIAQPSVRLRSELRRQYEARQAMAREEIPLDFDGTAGATAYMLPIGLNVKNVFVAGTKKRAGSTKDYTVSYDGYRQTVNFGVSPGATWVQITVNRSI